MPPFHFEFQLRLGAITSPTIYNNATLRAQGDLSPCCILNGVSVSVFCYAGDVLNLSRTVISLEKVLGRLLRIIRRLVFL